MSVATSGAGADDDKLVTKGFAPGVYRREVIRLESWIRKIFKFLSKVKGK